MRRLGKLVSFALPPLTLGLCVVACGGGPSLDDGIDGSSGGATASGGLSGSGGHGTATGGRSSGGASHSGGQTGSGGRIGSGGGPSSGGAPGSGGAPSSGGTEGDSGGTSSGGFVNTTRLEFIGNITTSNQVDFNDLTYSDYWNQITPENAGKWGSVQSNAGSAFNWMTLDAIYDYAESKGIIFKQHAFVWGSQQPSGSPSAAQVETWIQSFCERYPNTKIIDVVNEPPPHTTPSYTDALGGGTNGNWQWVATAFEMAREHCGDAVLLLNDFNNIEWNNDVNHNIDIVQAIQALGAPIDAIGAQAHDLDNGAISFQTVQGMIQRLHDETGLPIYITEFDISTGDDQAQLQKYEQYFPFFEQTEYIRGVTIWGWIRGRTWSQAPESGIVSQQGVSRPAMTWLMDWLGRESP